MDSSNEISEKIARIITIVTALTISAGFFIINLYLSEAAFKCLERPSRSRKAPVESMTKSTPNSFQGSFSGSLWRD